MPAQFPIIIAHRGYASRHPENTLEALEAAIRNGVRHVEFDVHPSADGVPFLLHDVTLDRTTGLAGIALDMPAEALRTIRVLGSAGSEPETLPELAGAAARLATHRDIVAFVEIKPQGVPRHGAAAVMEACAAALRPLGSAAIITSFDADVIAEARDRGFRTAWVLRRYDDDAFERARELAPDVLFCDVDKLPAAPERLRDGPWDWAVYEVTGAEEALDLWRRGARFIESMRAPELIAEVEAMLAATDEGSGATPGRPESTT